MRPNFSALSSLEAILGCFLIFAFAFAAGKTGLFDLSVAKRLNSFANKILLPFFMFGAFQVIPDNSSNVYGGIFVNLLLIAVISMTVFAVIAHFCSGFERKASARSEKYAMTFCDYAAFGIPLMYTYGGRNWLFFSATFILISYIFDNLVGKKTISGRINLKKAAISTVLSPLFIASVIGLLLNLIGASLPQVISNPICFSGAFASPLIIASIGIIASKVALNDLVKNKKAIILCIMKMVLFPLLVFSVMLILNIAFGIDTGIIYTSTVLSALPCSAATYFNSVKYKADVKEASVMCTLTTLLSVISLPVVTLIAISLLK